MVFPSSVVPCPTALVAACCNFSPGLQYLLPLSSTLVQSCSDAALCGGQLQSCSAYTVPWKCESGCNQFLQLPGLIVDCLNTLVCAVSQYMTSEPPQVLQHLRIAIHHGSPVSDNPIHMLLHCTIRHSYPLTRCALRAFSRGNL